MEEEAMKDIMTVLPSPCVSTANSVWNSPARLPNREDTVPNTV